MASQAKILQLPNSTMKAPAMYLPNFLSEAEATLAFSVLWNLLPWERRYDAPRREIWMNKLGESYTYGKGAGERTYEAHPFHSTVSSIARELNKLGTLMQFEGCFLNGYEGERDHLGWHSDDDPRIDHQRPIAVITLYTGKIEAGMSGADREIQFREIRRPGLATPEKVPEKQLLGQGSLLIMEPGMQQTHQHRIPKVSFISRPRISLTYRGLVRRRGLVQ